MQLIYTFTGRPSPNDFAWYPRSRFLREFRVKHAIGYLQQVRGTLEGEALNHRRSGNFWTALRHFFAEIEGLGRLYVGEFGPNNTQINAVAFGTRYLARVNPRYSDLFGLTIDMFRHGLAHGHMPRSVRYYNRSRRRYCYVNWRVTEARAEHLAIKRVGPEHTCVVLSVSLLIEDALAAIDRYAADLAGGNARSRLFTRFRRGYEGACTMLTTPPPSLTSPARLTPPAKHSRIITLKAYAQAGIAVVSTEELRLADG